MRNLITLFILIFTASTVTGQISKRHNNSKSKRFVNHVIHFEKKSVSTIQYRLDSMIFMELNENSQWDITDKEEFIYDENGNLIQYIYSEKYSPEEPFSPEEKTEFKYNEEGKKDTITYYEWYGTPEEWHVGYREVLTYDESGICTLVTVLGWDETNQEWITYGKDEYTYDNNQNNTQLLSYDWESTSETWIKSYKEEYTYDANNNMIQTLYSYWDEGANEWFTDDKEEFAFDANGIPTQYIDYALSEDLSEWVKEYKWEYTMDENNNTTIEMSYEWDVDQWIMIDKWEYSYDNSLTISDLIIPHPSFLMPDYADIMQNKLIDFSYKEWDGNNWIEYNKGSYYYSEQETEETTGITDMLKSKVSIYPNPATDYLTIALDEMYHSIDIEIIDLQGKTIMKRKVSNNEHISVDQLNKGVYIFRIMQDNELIQTNKLLIQ